MTFKQNGDIEVQGELSSQHQTILTERRGLASFGFCAACHFDSPPSTRLALLLSRSHPAGATRGKEDGRMFQR